MGKIDFLKMGEEFAIVASDTCKKVGRTDLVGPLSDACKRLGRVVDRHIYPKGTLQFHVSNTIVNENAGTVSLTVDRINGDNDAASVQYMTNDGSAVAGVNYVSLTGTLIWQDGDSSPKTITVTLLDDGVVANDKTFSVKLNNPKTATLGLSSTTVVVKNTDSNPPPPPPPPPPGGRQLLGGWRLNGEFARGTLAMDIPNNKCWITGHGQRNEIYEYNLTTMGTGSDINAWPELKPARIIQGWWTGGYGCGLIFWKNKLWVSPKTFYDTNPPPNLTLFAQDGETITVNLPRQQYAGFVKRGVGADPYLGCGGYESGQGWATGPSLATLNGTPLINYPQTVSWELREYREPNYYPVGHIDSWLALEPRMENGELKGKWACDRVYGGGLELPEGITYWTWQGIGDIDYARQNETFAASNKTYAYVYDKTTYRLISRTETNLGQIGGQEMGADGKIYLCELNAWRSGLYTVDPVVKVFQ